MKMWRWSVFLLLFIHSIHADRIAHEKSSTEELGPQIQPSIESDDNRRQFFINVNAIPGPGVIFFTVTYYITQFIFGAFFLINAVACALFRTCSTVVVRSTSTTTQYSTYTYSVIPFTGTSTATITSTSLSTANPTTSTLIKTTTTSSPTTTLTTSVTSLITTTTASTATTTTALTTLLTSTTTTTAPAGKRALARSVDIAEQHWQNVMNLREHEVIRPTVLYVAMQHTALAEGFPHDADEFH